MLNHEDLKSDELLLYEKVGNVLNTYELILYLSENIYSLKIIHPIIVLENQNKMKTIIKACKLICKEMDNLQKDEYLNPDNIPSLDEFNQLIKDNISGDLIFTELTDFIYDNYQGKIIPFNNYELYIIDKNGFKYLIK